MPTPSIKKAEEHIVDPTTYKKLGSDPNQAVKNDVLSTLYFPRIPTD